MPDFYVYLLSSLPSLQFGMRPPFSFARLQELCKGLIPDKDIAMLGQADIGGNYSYGEKQETLKKWQEFDRSLRNELVRLRASRKHFDPEKYLRPDGHDAALAHLALAAHRNPSLLEAEKMLDEYRWAYLDEAQEGHFFDLDSLLVYAHKLLILERWQRIDSADKKKLLEEAVLN